MSNAVAKTKGVEVSTEVVVDMFEDGAEGAVFAADDLLIPRLQLAQKMSPELDENDAKYIDGIKAGNFFNSVSREIYTEFDVIPCHSRTSYTEWVPRDQGGGLVAEHEADSRDVKGAETHVSDDGKRKDLMQSGNELVIADEFYAFIVKEDGDYEPVLISMKSSQRKVAKRWRTLISMNKARNPKTNQLQSVAIYSTLWKLTSVTEANKNNDKYSNFAVQKIGPITADKQDLYHAAKQFRESIIAGEVKAVQEEDVSSSKTTDENQSGSPLDKDDEVPF
jgi:hypothetical protein